jgi:hypothetical protein
MSKPWYEESPAEFAGGFDLEEVSIHHMKEGTLVASSTSGRYALGDPLIGPEITSGTSLAIEIGGQWIWGSVEYTHALYVNMGMQYLGEPPRTPRILDGYYFVSRGDLGICGLCVGMHVRIP